jgi:hypothetical protein
VKGAQTVWDLGRAQVPLKANRGWTGKRSKMSIGHIINHVPPGLDKDVDFYFVLLPDDMDKEMLWHLPSINARTQAPGLHKGTGYATNYHKRRWAVLAVAARTRAFADGGYVTKEEPVRVTSDEAGSVRTEAGKVRHRAPLSLPGEVEIYADYGLDYGLEQDLGWQVFQAKHNPDRFLQPIVSGHLCNPPDA